MEFPIHSNATFPILVFTGTEYGVAWQDGQEIYFARISSTGSKIGSDVRITNDLSYSAYPCPAFTGSEYGVAWEDNRDGNSEIYFARISSDGIKTGSDVRITDATEFSGDPSLVFTSSEFGISWYDSRDGNSEIYFAMIASDGSKIGADIRITNATGFSSFPILYFSGSEYGLAWSDERDGDREIYFTRISSSGSKIG